jgi:hypothetical protein
VAVNASIAVNLLIGLAVLALLVYRQLQVRPVRANFRLPLILAVIGVIQLSQFLKHDHHTGTVLAALAGSLALAAITGAIRAMTVRVWIQAGQALRQGTWITALLWVVSLGVHLGYDYLVDGKGSQAGLGTASLTLYFALTYTIQRFILQAKAQRIADSPHQDTRIGS